MSSESPAPLTPGEVRFRELLARLAGRTGMSPMAVEMATEGRVRASEIADLIAAQAQSQAQEVTPAAPPAQHAPPPEQQATHPDTHEEA